MNERFYVQRASPSAGERPGRVTYLMVRGGFTEDALRARIFFSAETAQEQCRTEWDRVVSQEEAFGLVRQNSQNSENFSG